MKIPLVMWSVILFELQPANQSIPSKEIFNLIKEANLDQYEYLKDQYPYSDTIWDICADLKEIDLEYNNELKDLFFQYWKNVKYSNKLRIFKNLDMPAEEKFTTEIKKYLAQHIIEYPCIMELYRFRKEISQEELKKGLNNIYKQITFYFMKNQPKQDYWENHISGKEEEKLLDLIELSGMRKEELTEFNKIGFINPTRQARFDRLNNQESTLPLFQSHDTEVYMITTKINSVILLKEEPKLGSQFLTNATQYMSALIKNSIKTEPVEIMNIGSNNPVKFITEDRAVFDRAIIKRNVVIEWMENNTSELINLVRNHSKHNKTLLDLEKDTKELAEKILFKNKLENKLIEKNIKTKGIKKI